jgi:hypothetical protein
VPHHLVQQLYHQDNAAEVPMGLFHLPEDSELPGYARCSTEEAFLEHLDKAVEDIQADKEDTCHSPWVEGTQHVPIAAEALPGPADTNAWDACMAVLHPEEAGTLPDIQNMHHLDIYLPLLPKVSLRAVVPHLAEVSFLLQHHCRVPVSAGAEPILHYSSVSQ